MAELARDFIFSIGRIQRSPGDGDKQDEPATPFSNVLIVIGRFLRLVRGARTLRPSPGVRCRVIRPSTHRKTRPINYAVCFLYRGGGFRGRSLDASPPQVERHCAWRRRRRRVRTPELIGLVSE